MNKILGRLLTALLVFGTTPTLADEILVTDDNFAKYFKDAKPGDVFAIYPGIYRLPAIIDLDASGTPELPITVRPATEGQVRIEVQRPIGFKITAPYWIVEGLEFVGVCGHDNDCEHAFQIVGKADNTIVRNNKMIDFNAAIKGNGTIIDDTQYFPDHVLIENNQIYNRRPRQTGNPVTPIDVVGGRYWTVRENFIADHHKALGDNISYAAFLKGNSDNGLFERNLVVCEWRHSGGVRLGLSLGGGGTSDPRFCQGRSCKIQHYKGTIRSNVIMNCPADVGIYLNNAASTQVVNNTIINTVGVDVRFSGSFATFANNIIEGRILARDSGRFREYNNLVERDLSDFIPNKDKYDLSPLEPEELMKAARGFEGVDFCTGTPQETWVGAIAQPAKCSVLDRIREVSKDRD